MFQKIFYLFLRFRKCPFATSLGIERLFRQVGVLLPDWPHLRFVLAGRPLGSLSVSWFAPHLLATHYKAWEKTVAAIDAASALIRLNTLIRSSLTRGPQKFKSIITSNSSRWVKLNNFVNAPNLENQIHGSTYRNFFVPNFLLHH